MNGTNLKGDAGPSDRGAAQRTSGCRCGDTADALKDRNGGKLSPATRRDHGALFNV
jgi:hypothetical protein